jgi:excisionase family DNA binding protein
MGEELLNIEQAAAAVGTYRKKIERLIADGYLPAYRSVVDRRVRLVKRADLDRVFTTLVPIEVAPRDGQGKAAA